ncbi:type II toxin-antitoxin system RelB/DinJ family antitoxin [Acidithiobacillus ferrivorans]|uniref:type II toxin-antitoxin system RelB/DinJ family antitoxin n=1 Tax=Acidithiobacillus ferrivorans TaxID=160808 RepID=UPI0029549C0E|nr:type II toxin-antitoxin system RelB/DinJ family antitoxin [Acidithiobacillus ferrivorans]
MFHVYGAIIAANAFVRARIDEGLKNEAAAVLADMGLTISDVVRIVLTKVAMEKALPFEMRVPNKLTVETLAKVNVAKMCIMPVALMICSDNWVSDAAA